MINVDGAEDYLLTIDEDLKQFQQDPLVSEALKEGVDLTQYAQDIDKQLQELQDQSARDLTDSRLCVNLSQLYQDVDVVDAMLETIQDTVLRFQKNLSSVNNEMRELHDKCLGIDCKVENRGAVRFQIRNFIHNVGVSPAMRKSLQSTPVDDPQFMLQVKALNKKIRFIRSGNLSMKDGSKMHPGTTIAVQKLVPDIESLRAMAVSRVNTFLAKVFADLKKADALDAMVSYGLGVCQNKSTVVSVGVIIGARLVATGVYGRPVTKNQLQKHRFFLALLGDHAPQALQKLMETYIGVMARSYEVDLKTYAQGLLKAHERTMPGKASLIVVRKKMNKQLQPSHLGDIQKRLEVLDNRARLQPIELKDARASPYSFEELLRAILIRIKSKTTLEAAFLVQFFGTEVDVEIMFKNIFEKTLNEIIHSLTSHINGSFDMVAMLLSVLLVRIYGSKDKGSSSSEHELSAPFFRTVESIFRERVLAIQAASVANLKGANPRSLGAMRSSGSHEITRRFAQWNAAVLVLQPELVKKWPSTSPTIDRTDDRQLISSALREMGDAFALLLTKLSERYRKPKDRSMFMINNVCQLLETNEQFNVVLPQREMFQELMDQATEVFVREELKQHFPELIALIEQKRAGKDTKRALSKAIPALAAHYKTALQKIHTEVVTNFSRNFSSVLQKVFEQLVEFFKQFHEIAAESSHAVTYQHQLVQDLSLDTLINVIRKYCM